MAIAAAYTTTVGEPLTLLATVTDTPLTTVTFSEPGQYRLMAIGNDDSSAPGDGSTRQCCWTTAHVDVTVNP